VSTRVPARGCLPEGAQPACVRCCTLAAACLTHSANISTTSPQLASPDCVCVCESGDQIYRGPRRVCCAGGIAQGGRNERQCQRAAFPSSAAIVVVMLLTSFFERGMCSDNQWTCR
jgi:hypothetical protein